MGMFLYTKMIRFHALDQLFSSGELDSFIMSFSHGETMVLLMIARTTLILSFSCL